MLEDVDEGGIRPWHLVKPSEEPEPPRPRRGSLRGGERERAKAIPEIYLTRLLSMKVALRAGTGQAVGWGVGRAGLTWCHQAAEAGPGRGPLLTAPPVCLPTPPTGDPAEVRG